MHDSPPLLTTLPNGVRVLVLPLAHVQTAAVSVYIRTGSAHEPRKLHGISHVVEHMVFKGAGRRSAHRINLDAERLGAEVNAHTDKDHTAFYIRGLAAHAPRFVHMLADLVRRPLFPADELEREREVLLSEHAEVQDDPMSAAFELFDRACWGSHPAAQSVIGLRHTIESLTRQDMVDYVQQRYSGANVVVAVAGQVDPQALLREVDAAFGSMQRGVAHSLSPPAWSGGMRTRCQAGTSQAHWVLGFAAGARADDDPAAEVAATVLGEGMSSPLLSELRERRGLVYHVACALDRFEMCGQFTIEAACAPAKLDECLRVSAGLLSAQADQVTRIDLERARNQMAMRLLRTRERPARWLEESALDVLACGRVRSPAERLAQVHAVTAAQVRAVFQRMLASGAAAGLAGSLGRGIRARLQEGLGPLLRQG